MNTFLDCPYKWKKQYINKIKSKASYPMMRGIRIHEKIEKFYDAPEKSTQDPELENLFKFQRRLTKDSPKEKYCKPIFKELKMEDEELALKGIVDAVFINPKDDGVIVIDWKTGKYRPEKFDNYRFELAVYVELLKASGKVDNIKYWGIYFIDHDKLFFEEVKEEHIKKMYDIAESVRAGINSGNYPATKNMWCKYCQFKKECGAC